jgi:myo-inositol-1(or 4)-monophosphatase
MYLQQICSYVKDACKETGTFIRNEQTKIQASNIEVKGLNDFVSYVDKTSEQMLIERLDKLIFDAGYIAEEGTRTNHGKEFNWIIDPLDGTTNYLHGLPPHAISIALQQEETLVMGVVYEIVSGEMFYAWKDGGAWLNGQKIHVSTKNSLKDSLIATGFPYHDFSKMKAYMQLFEYLMQNTHGIRRLGSAAVDLAYVACGRMDAFYEYGLKSWDVAAGGFIVKEAGGEINDFYGENDWLFGQQMVCGTKDVCSELTDLTKKYF